MKDFFEQYLNNMPSSSSGTPSKTQDKSGAQASTPIPDSTDLLAKKADVLQPPAAQADNPESNLPPETDEPVSLWETKILKTVLPSKLVWAPFYRFGNQRFCARICDNDEIERDLYIQTPILDSEVVVEFIRVPTTKRMDTRLLKVEKNKILPYYGKIEADEATCLTHWNVNLLKKMHKAIKDRCSVANTEHIFTGISKASEEYLREALKFEEDLRVANLQFPTLYTSSPAGPRKALYSPSGNRSEPLFDLLTFSRVPTSSSSEPETLGVGDHICYASELNSDTIVHTRIVGFSENTSAPLLLENEAHLVPKKRVRKLVSTVSAQGILEYDLRSGHYHALGDYVLLRNEGGIEKSSTGAAKSASTARTSPPSAEPLSSPQVRAHPSGKKRQRTATPPPSSSPGTAAPATEATGPPSAQSLKNVKTSKTSDGESQTSAKKKKAQKIQKTPRAAEEAKAMSMSMATQLSQASQASSTSWSCLFNNNSTAADSSQDASSLSLTMAEADSSVAGSQQKVGSASKTPSRRSSSRNQTPSAGLSGGPRCSTFTEPAVEGQSSCSVSSSGLKGKEEGAGKAGPSRSSPRSAVKAARGTTRTPSGADTATTATAESHTTPLGGSTTPVDAASTGDSIELRASSRKWMNSPVESTARSGSAVKSSGGKVAKR